MKIVLPLLLLSFMSAAAWAQAPQLSRVDVVEYGTYTAEVAQQVPESGSPSGSRNIVTNIRFVDRTTTVSAQVGTRFGVQWNLVGAPDGATVRLKLVTRFPSAGVRNPTTGTVTYMTEHFRDLAIGKPSLQGYGFDNPWEIVPGVWTFELWDGERKVGAMSFTVAGP